MFFSKEEHFTKKYIRIIKEFSILFEHIIDKKNNFISRSLTADIEIINKDIDESIDYIYEGAFMPVMRGDYLDILFNFTAVASNIIKIEQIIGSQLFSDNIRAEIFDKLNDYFKKLSETLDETGAAFEKQHWNIKTIYKNIKIENKLIKKEITQFLLQSQFQSGADGQLQNNIILFDVLNLLFLKIDQLFDSIFKLVVSYKLG